MYLSSSNAYSTFQAGSVPPRTRNKRKLDILGKFRTSDTSVFLPESVLLIVFSCLEFKQVAHLSSVCKYWRSVSQSPTLWKLFYKRRWGLLETRTKPLNYQENGARRILRSVSQSAVLIKECIVIKPEMKTSYDNFNGVRKSIVFEDIDNSDNRDWFKSFKQQHHERRNQLQDQLWKSWYDLITNSYIVKLTIHGRLQATTLPVTIVHLTDYKLNIDTEFVRMFFSFLPRLAPPAEVFMYLTYRIHYPNLTPNRANKIALRLVDTSNFNHFIFFHFTTE
eukprot:TRINITY_DN4977_c0_g1_i3.p1 TRINITY_DN4977_c0_g1~~TRINITY_DN4977_c0_g1_i3.p1  ORF type:complete len:279 (+),score=19.31 TRINITY_DN4977_c0_g1_i3:3-839(+)